MRISGISRRIRREGNSKIWGLYDCKGPKILFLYENVRFEYWIEKVSKSVDKQDFFRGSLIFLFSKTFMCILLREKAKKKKI